LYSIIDCFNKIPVYQFFLIEYIYMKIPSSVRKLLENKYVLYIVFFLALTNLFGYMVMGNYKAIALFVLVGYLVHNFNKNMILVLGVPLILTAIFTSGFIREGAVGSMGAENTDEKKASPSTEKTTAEKTAEDEAAKKASATANASPSPIDASTTHTPDVKVDASTGAAVTKVSNTASNTPAPNGTEKAAFSNPYDKRGSRLDYAATVEDAYGDLNNILGGDGIKNLTADTQKLMNQQLQLAEAMKSMTPLLEQAKSLIGGFDMKNFGNITEMAKQFKASGSN
jgi:hypothetical protein